MKQLLTLLLLALRFSTWAQSPGQNDCQCCSAAHNEFDFWIGIWDVYNPEGQQVGHNEIKAVEGHCGLQENWTGASGITGTSLNYYDPTAEKWFQIWIDQSGGILNLSGTFSENQMILWSELQYSKKLEKHYKSRVTWTANEDGTVRQLWENTTDDGKTWTTVFDGLYKRMEK